MRIIIDEQTYYQLGRYLSRECSRTEARAIEAWAQGSPEREALLAGMRTLWETKGDGPPQWNVDACWKELDKLIGQAGFSAEMPASQIPANAVNQDEPAKLVSSRRRLQLASYRPGGFRFWLVRVAAALLLVGFVTLLVREIVGPPEAPSGSLALREVSTEPGQRVSLHLDDGTRVRMNAGSALKMPGSFSDQVRMVHLSGEAYFEVTVDSRPFIVATDRGHMIEVLGTEFNVASYRDEPFRVVVSGGLVSVHGMEQDRSGNDPSLMQDVARGQADGQAGQGIRLERGQMMTEQGGSVQVHRDVDLSRQLAWLEHRLVFDDTPLRQVARTLERWYRVEIVLRDPGQGDLRVTASFENEPVYEVFRSLSLSLNLDYEIQGRQVVFLSRK